MDLQSGYACDFAVALFTFEVNSLLMKEQSLFIPTFLVAVVTRACLVLFFLPSTIKS